MLSRGIKIDPDVVAGRHAAHFDCLDSTQNQFRPRLLDRERDQFSIGVLHRYEKQSGAAMNDDSAWIKLSGNSYAKLAGCHWLRQ